MSKKLVKWYDYNDVLANRRPKFIFATSSVADGRLFFKVELSRHYSSIFCYDDAGFRVVISRPDSFSHEECKK